MHRYWKFLSLTFKKSLVFLGVVIGPNWTLPMCSNSHSSIFCKASKADIFDLSSDQGCCKVHTTYWILGQKMLENPMFQA